ncbi:Bug family tripartite tricarboxylate transporter substrate binding protein [Falsiroseomonas tokyonensis]|uniref:Bug family tripartite tricarboxylate transporter substrate binding protein n=1 Tax=Falsiroseomonas tokyonensis TaxID=430521 RepID=A0ABV7BLI5_9PROT|nr:tripartite tricarboxylate transporter substrate binding protein [Falsiroseomonas tokyonensis]MBU8536404.1 tripartite tricarboxylate transporter substrate binding protein [Falsiroseomonas tokyonensis]
MNLRRRSLFAAPALLAATPLRAQEAWPNRPIRMVLPYAPGGATDVIGRLVADRLSQRLPQRVVMENRTGAGGAIGSSFVAKAPGDGHTLLFHNIGHAVTKAIYPQLDYDPAADLKAVSIVAESPMVLLVPPNSPHRTLADFVAAARANPEKLTYGSTGGGGALQLVSLLFLRAAGIKMTEVPYRGGAPAALDLASGTLDMLYDAGLTGFGLAQGGRARALAISGPSRSPVMPDVPTMAEAGFPDATFMVWQAILAPAATPDPLLARIQAEVAAVLAEPATRTRLAELGAERLVGNSPAEAHAFVTAEMAKWAVILREAGVRAG